MDNFGAGAAGAAGAAIVVADQVEKKERAGWLAHLSRSCLYCRVQFAGPDIVIAKCYVLCAGIRYGHCQVQLAGIRHLYGKMQFAGMRHRH